MFGLPGIGGLLGLEGYGLTEEVQTTNRSPALRSAVRADETAGRLDRDVHRVRKSRDSGRAEDKGVV